MNEFTTRLTTFCIAALMCFTTLSFANLPSSQFEQLYNVNKEWINQFDLDPSIYSNPSEPLNEIELIQKHLSIVEATLRKRATDHLSIKQKANRSAMLDVLNTYWKAGVFPQNIYHKERTPYFIDHLGTHCAVGHLVKESGYGELAKGISENDNYIYVRDIQDVCLLAWADRFGFTIDELAWIQPSYNPCSVRNFISEVKYAQIGSDDNEFIEVFINAHSIGFIEFVVQLYDENGTVYATISDNEFCQNVGPCPILNNPCYQGAFDIYVLNLQSETLINNNGGIALNLINPFNASDTFNVDFVSYGGTIVASEGIAAGKTSIDMGFTQDETSSIDESIGRFGNICNSNDPEYINYAFHSACGVNDNLVLPVDLGSFEIKKVNKGVQIDWETFSEINSAGFSLEKSTDGIFFESIYYANSLGEDGKGYQYKYFDEEVKPGLTYYYRLVQEDLNGYLEIFQTKSMNIPFLGDKEISIYPNPAFGKTVNIDSYGEEAFKVEIFNLGGSLISTQQNTLGSIDVSNLNSGIYILNIYTNGKMLSEKLLIQ